DGGGDRAPPGPGAWSFRGPDGGAAGGFWAAAQGRVAARVPGAPPHLLSGPRRRAVRAPLPAGPAHAGGRRRDRTEAPGVAARTGRTASGAAGEGRRTGVAESLDAAPVH